MPRPIDADALLERLTKKKPKAGKARYTDGYNDALLVFRSMIHGAPTVEAAPVKCGTWVKQVKVARAGGPSLYYYQCSLCGVYIAKQANYCPNCGAKMEG